MKQDIDPALHLLDFEPRTSHFRSDVIRGLGRQQKRLPSKYFYDQRGSILFDQICQLQEYYPTRTELAIMRSHVGEMGETLGEDCLLVEFGSGSSLKTRVLLDHLQSPAGYVPIDISRAHLIAAARGLARRYPGLDIRPVCADYTSTFRLPQSCEEASRVVVYFPGSTIGNFNTRQAVAFLKRTHGLCGTGSGLLIGVDLKKDPARLHAAYNDADGVTAAFNLNLLTRINRELDGDFVLDAFAHYAFYNPRRGRIEMHLASLEKQSATAAGQRFDFAQGKTIFTECSHKYTIGQFADLAADAGYRLEHVWTDDQQLFSVQYLTAV